MSVIIPAILEMSVGGFKDKVFKVERVSGVERIQVDFCDGVFVPTKTIAVVDIEGLNPAFFWEAHVMAASPSHFFDYQLAGFSKIIVHLEAFASDNLLRSALIEIAGLGLIPAVALNPETDARRLLALSDLVREFTIMTVHPGSQGAPFLSECLDKVKFLRKELPGVILEVDGGVSMLTIREVFGSGASLAAAGSALFRDGGLQENFDELVEGARSVISKE